MNQAEMEHECVIFREIVRFNRRIPKWAAGMPVVTLPIPRRLPPNWWMDVDSIPKHIEVETVTLYKENYVITDVPFGKPYQRKIFSRSVSEGGAVLLELMRAEAEKVGAEPKPRPQKEDADGGPEPPSDLT